MKFMFFSGVIPLEKVKIIRSCGILIFKKTENSLESVVRARMYYASVWNFRFHAYSRLNLCLNPSEM